MENTSTVPKESEHCQRAGRSQKKVQKQIEITQIAASNLIYSIKDSKSASG